jgi:hypothetical protein
MNLNIENAAAIAKVVTFEQALEIKAQLDAAHEAIVWPEGCGTGPMGLTPDHIKFAAPYRAANARSQNIMAIMRKFNQVYSKRFKKEIRAHIDAKRAAKIAANAE